MRNYDDLTKEELEFIDSIEIGEEYRFGDIWDGNHDGRELLEDGSYSPDEYNVIAFDVIEDSENPAEAIVKITDIY